MTFLDYAQAISHITQNRERDNQTSHPQIRGTITKEEAAETLKNLHEAFRATYRIDAAPVFAVEFEDDIDYGEWEDDPNAGVQ